MHKPNGLSRSTLLMFRIFPLLLLLAVPFGGPATAEPLQPERIDREGLDRAVDHLLAAAGPSGGTRLDPSVLGPLIDFVAAEKESGKLYHFGKRDEAASAYNEFDIRRSLCAVLRYAYNPDIPTHVFRPSSIRMTQWLEVNGEEQPLPRLWTHLSALEVPVVVTGVEGEENTPEQATGACYGYVLDRALVLLEDGGRKVLISVSRQRDESENGKKGACLGGDRNWDYLYTGEEGLTRTGLGWADTHIYEAASIAVYCEVDPASPLVRCGVFKWIRAGWAGLNMVKTKHIHEGMKRFARGFQETIHHPRLPDPDRLAGMFAWIKSLPDAALRARVNEYLKGLQVRYAEEKVLSKKSFEELMEAGDYASRMTRAQMESVLSLEYMKWVLGKSTVLGEAFRAVPDAAKRRISSMPCPPPG